MENIEPPSAAIERELPQIDANGQSTAANGLPLVHVHPADLDVDGWEVSCG